MTRFQYKFTFIVKVGGACKTDLVDTSNLMKYEPSAMLQTSDLYML